MEVQLSFSRKVKEKEEQSRDELDRTSQLSQRKMSFNDSIGTTGLND